MLWTVRLYEVNSSSQCFHCWILHEEDCELFVRVREATSCSMWLPRGHGTVYRRTSRRHHRCQRSSVTSRQFSSLEATPQSSLAHHRFISPWLASFSSFCAVSFHLLIYGTIISSFMMMVMMMMMMMYKSLNVHCVQRKHPLLFFCITLSESNQFEWKFQTK